MNCPEYPYCSKNYMDMQPLIKFILLGGTLIVSVPLALEWKLGILLLGFSAVFCFASFSKDVSVRNSMRPFKLLWVILTFYGWHISKSTNVSDIMRLFTLFVGMFLFIPNVSGYDYDFNGLNRLPSGEALVFARTPLLMFGIPLPFDYFNLQVGWFRGNFGMLLNGKLYQFKKIGHRRCRRTIFSRIIGLARFDAYDEDGKLLISVYLPWRVALALSDPCGPLSNFLRTL